MFFLINYKKQGEKEVIEKEKIEAIKRAIDLIAYIESRGITLKKKGKSYFGLCPFHKEKTPSFSINPQEKLWNCFGCKSGGDVFRFVELFDKVDFKEAVRRLEPLVPHLAEAPKPSSQKPQEGKALTVKEYKLLGKVVSYYQHTLEQDMRGIDYLKKERGITDNQSIKGISMSLGSSFHVRKNFLKTGNNFKSVR